MGMCLRGKKYYRPVCLLSKRILLFVYLYNIKSHVHSQGRVCIKVGNLIYSIKKVAETETICFPHDFLNQSSELDSL